MKRKLSFFLAVLCILVLGISAVAAVYAEPAVRAESEAGTETMNGPEEETKTESSSKSFAEADAETDAEAQEEAQEEEPLLLTEPEKVTVTDADGSETRFVVSLSDYEAGAGASLTAAVWSEKGGQDDLKWIPMKAAGSVWQADVLVSDFRTAGLYYVDVYDFTGSAPVFAGGSTFTVSAPTAQSVSVRNYNEAAGTCEIVVSGVKSASGIREIQVPVWCAADQSDIYWYKAVKEDSDTWTAKIDVSRHGYHTGTYYADAYAKCGNEVFGFLGGTTVSFTIDVKPARGVSVVTDNAAGTFTVTVTGVSGGAAAVLVPVWCAQDHSDIYWYPAAKNAAGDYVATGSVANHKYHTGTYYADAYEQDAAGNMSFIAGSTMDFTISFDSIIVGSSGDGRLYPVTITNLVVPGGPKYVVFPVWSKKNGQDDIQWYKATQSGNNYTATVDIAKHKSTGAYEIHVYAMTQGGDMIFLGKADDLNVDASASAQVSVTDVNESAGTFTVRIATTSSAPVKSVLVPVWCANDQSDIYWYTAEQESANVFKAKVDISRHDNHLGVYKIDTYGTLENGIQLFMGGTTLDFNPANYIVVSKTGTSGERQISIRNVSGAASKVTFAVWSEAGGQDDLTWNTAVNNGGGTWSTTINVSRYKHDGVFNVHAYVNDACVSAKTFKVDKSELGKNGWYYENGLKLYYVNDVLQTDLRGMVGGPYQICVNRTCNTITVYSAQGESDYIIPVVSFVCSVGLPDTPTPAGIYYTGAKYRWKELMGPSYGQYVTHVVDGVYFHSVAGVNMTSYNLDPHQFNLLGNAASHGCIRMCVRDAKWLYDNVPSGTQVKIYDSASPGPYGKPVLPKIPPGQNWDPTDPNI